MDWLVDCDEVRLADEVGRALTTVADSPLWRDLRFIDWLAADAREQDRASRRRSERELAARGSAMLARVRARQLGVKRSCTVPLLRQPSFAGNPRDVLRHATHERAVPVVDLGVAAGIGRELWDEPVESWLDLPPELPEGEYLALKVSGESMAPLMHTGDTILLKLGSQAQRDTVVVARHPEDGYVCKRVGRVGRDTIDLASLEPGRAAIKIPHRADLIVGTVLMVWCKHRS
jgi:phage repressor protein C with HTH and peptisase S24 domain